MKLYILILALFLAANGMEKKEKRRSREIDLEMAMQQTQATIEHEKTERFSQATKLKMACVASLTTTLGMGITLATVLITNTCNCPQ